MSKDVYREIEFENLRENSLNCRSMDPAAIADLAEAIRKTGHIDPLVVRDNRDGTYTILSGHRRYAAVKSMGYMGRALIPCIVSARDFGGYAAREEEYMLSENFSRKSQEDIKSEILIASGIWDRLPAQDREGYKAAYRREFEAENQSNPNYLKDPVKYISNRFRPRIYFIKKKTGTGCSGRLIESYIAEALRNAGEDPGSPEEKEKAGKRRITAKNVLRCAESLHGLLTAWENQGDCTVEDTETIDEALAEFITALRA